jgi:hypothetical protein
MNTTSVLLLLCLAAFAYAISLVPKVRQYTHSIQQDWRDGKVSDALLQKKCLSTLDRLLAMIVLIVILLCLFSTCSRTQPPSFSTYTTSDQMAQEPKIIISTYVGSFKRYVFNAPFGPDNIRKPNFTDDMEKAMRFFDKADAIKYYTRFRPDGKKYEAEPLQTKQRA